MARPDHRSTCPMKTHKNGKWCWLPSEIEELKRQKAAGMTFNDVSKSFVTNGINRHDTHQCNKKFSQLFHEELKRK